MRNNPLIKATLQRMRLAALLNLLGSVLLMWVLLLWLLEQLVWEIIPGVEWQFASLLMVLVWYTPVLSLTAAVALTISKTQQDTFRVVKSTALSQRDIVLSLSLDVALRLRWLLIASPVLILMASTYRNQQFGQIYPPVELPALTIIWLLAHAIAICAGVVLALRFSERYQMWLYAAIFSGAALAVTGLLRDSLAWACALRVEVAPLPWLFAGLALAALMIAYFTMRPTQTAEGPTELGITVALIIALIASSGWISGVQRQLERRALIAFPAVNEAVWRDSVNWPNPNDHCDWDHISCTCGRVRILISNPIVSLQQVPSQIGALHYLQVLELFDGELTELPRRAGELNYLTRLNLGANDLSEVPEVLPRVRQLRFLYLNSNNIEVLPSNIGQLTYLEELSVPSNQLTDLPSELATLRYLRVLQVSSNDLSHLPDNIDQLESLEEIYVEDNQLVAIPNSLWALPNLIELRAGFNQLTEVPSTVAQAKQIEVLSLGANCISELPPEIGSLPNLIALRLFENCLKSLPEEIVALSSLTVLDVSDNQLSELPEDIGQMNALQNLDVEGNQLTRLPMSVAQINALARLVVSDNQIEELPQNFSDLQGLQALDISYNPIGMLPPRFEEFQIEQHFGVENVPLEAVPQHLCPNLVADEETMRRLCPNN